MKRCSSGDYPNPDSRDSSFKCGFDLGISDVSPKPATVPVSAAGPAVRGTEDIASDERTEFRVATIVAFVVAAVVLLIPYVGGVSAWITLTQKMGGQTCAYFVCTSDLQGNLRYSNNTSTVDIPFCSSHSQYAPRSIGVPGAVWRIGIMSTRLGSRWRSC